MRICSETEGLECCKRGIPEETCSFLSVLSPLISKFPTGCGREDELFTVFHRFDIFGSPVIETGLLLNCSTKYPKKVLLHLKMVISYGRTSHRFLSTVLSISSASNLKVLWEIWCFIRQVPLFLYFLNLRWQFWAHVNKNPPHPKLSLFHHWSYLNFVLTNGQLLFFRWTPEANIEQKTEHPLHVSWSCCRPEPAKRGDRD